MDNTTIPTHHSWASSIALHLVPGVLIGLFYFLLRPVFIGMGFPPLFTLMLAVPLVLVPVQLGILLVAGRRRTGRLTLQGVLGYTRRIPAWHYAVWIPAVFVAAGLIFTLMQPVDAALREHIFFWVPTLDSGLDGGYGRSSLIITYAMVAVFGTIVGPAVEELYFRGYLLPRMRGRFAPLVHSVLFAVYHVFTPWMIVTRSVGLLPLVFGVRRENLFVGVGAHMLINSIDVVVGFAFIASMT